MNRQFSKQGMEGLLAENREPIKWNMKKPIKCQEEKVLHNILYKILNRTYFQKRNWALIKKDLDISVNKTIKTVEEFSRQ